MSHISRILITGGSSYLGRSLVPLAAQAHEVIYTFYRNDPLALPFGCRSDVREETAVARIVAEFQPQVIIHTVGSNRGDDFDDVIRRGTQNVTNAAVREGARLIHLSTDSIFNGLNPPYDETAVPTPITAYGRAKAEAEAIVAGWDNHVIVRTSLIYGLEQMDHGTIWMVCALQAGEPVQLFNNQFRNPVWIQTLSLACLELASNDYRGILNVAGRQEMSRADFALKMLDWWGLYERGSLTIGPSTGGHWPLDCRLNLQRATVVLSTPLPGVDEVLGENGKIL